MRYLLSILIFLLLVGCQPEQKTIINEQFNFIITPDLSNRIEDLYPKPISDVDLISGFYKNYYPEFYNINNRVIGQKDVIQFQFTNPKIIGDFGIKSTDLKMDLSKFNLKDRIEFLTKGGNLELLNTIDSEINRIYDLARSNTTGGDVYNYLKKEISPLNIRTKTESKKINGKQVVEIHRNIIILLTDGYVEAGLYGDKNCKGKKCYFLDKSKVDEFRNEFLKSGNSNLKDFFKQSGYGLIPVQNKALNHVEIFVSEIYDRSLNRKTGSQTITPNDFEIIKLFWSDWLEKSGVKKYKLIDTSNSEEEFLKELKGFIAEH